MVHFNSQVHTCEWDFMLLSLITVFCCLLFCYMSLNNIQGVFTKKVAPPQKKTFRNIFTSFKSFCMEFCKFVGNSCRHISTNFCKFIVIFSSNGINFSTSTNHFHLVRFWVGLFTHKMQMQIYGNDVIFVIITS